MPTVMAATLTERTERARRIADRVTDPELPMLTLADLGVLRDVVAEPEGGIAVTITPTYSGCPALATMRDDLVRALQQGGFDEVSVSIRLDPPWSSDWIGERGRAALRSHGISPPGPAPRAAGPIALNLLPTRRELVCPRCGSEHSELTSEFGSTACKALYRCADCLEPFEHLKEI